MSRNPATLPLLAARMIAAEDDYRRALAEYLAAVNAALADREAAPDPSAQLLTLAAAARRMGVARSTVSRWVASGALPAITLSGRPWVKVADLRRMSGGKS